ncbi:MAG: filamentous hemagglutinin N-terminal domain-containing protein, partial [Gammaproteobacteria bacterium]|nr:filamentous hemagglutinin N-terminal domain-containing protein [Gammaproteobacteria bacterium]
MKNIINGLLKRILGLGSLGLVCKTLLFSSTIVIAAPQGGTVVQGQGTIVQPTANVTTINQNTQNLAIDWNSFNLSSNESVTFNQPNASSVALNRILSASPSEIMGRINANGHVILSNQNGILFGANAQVNVGGLLATGLDIDPAQFMSGKFKLGNNGDAGFVINHGLLSAAVGGSINLVGGTVKNDGVIIADLGQINLLAGESAIVDFSGDGLLNFQITNSVKQNLSGTDSAAENNGVLQADGGKVVIEASVAQDIFSQAVNNTGIIRASKIERVGGVVRLSGSGGHVRNSGEINAVNGGEVVLDSSDQTEMSGSARIDVSNNNGVGGTVNLLGNKVGLFDNSAIDATGKTGGGSVKIGGDIQGGGTLKTADYTIMSNAASIDASATENGNGGTVVLWADKVSQIHGDIKARGGDQSGNGGFVETSGKEFLDVTSIPDAGAAVGDSGVWLLDPTNISIEERPATDLTQDEGSNVVTGPIGAATNP